MNPPHKTLAERALHAVAFEALAIMICAPVAAWLMNSSLPRMGLLTLAFSGIAMVWNVVFNALFDALQRRWRFRRGFAARLAHGLVFEVGMVLMTVPLAAWWLDITLWAAFLLDAGLLLFFLPYTMGFNWAYDVLRARWVARRLAVDRAAP